MKNPLLKYATIGEYIRAQRRALPDMSQEKLADETGLSRPTIINIEAGTIDPQFSTVLRILKVLNDFGAQRVNLYQLDLP